MYIFTSLYSYDVSASRVGCLRVQELACCACSKGVTCGGDRQRDKKTEQRLVSAVWCSLAKKDFEHEKETYTERDTELFLQFIRHAFVHEQTENYISCNFFERSSHLENLHTFKSPRWIYFLMWRHRYLYTAMEVMVMFSSQTIFRYGRVVDGGKYLPALSFFSRLWICLLVIGLYRK